MDKDLTVSKGRRRHHDPRISHVILRGSTVDITALARSRLQAAKLDITAIVCKEASTRLSFARLCSLLWPLFSE